jgi:hypothetical protein
MNDTHRFGHQFKDGLEVLKGTDTPHKPGQGRVTPFGPWLEPNWVNAATVAESLQVSQTAENTQA